MKEIEIILKVVLNREPTSYDIELFKNILIHSVANQYLDSGTAAVRTTTNVFIELERRAREITNNN